MIEEITRTKRKMEVKKSVKIMNNQDALNILQTKSFNDNPMEFYNAMNVAIASLESIIQVQEILNKRDNAFDGQEFGATYSDLDNIIEEIRKTVTGE